MIFYDKAALSSTVGHEHYLLPLYSLSVFLIVFCDSTKIYVICTIVLGIHCHWGILPNLPRKARADNEPVAVSGFRFCKYIFFFFFNFISNSLFHTEWAAICHTDYVSTLCLLISESLGHSWGARDTYINYTNL